LEQSDRTGRQAPYVGSYAALCVSSVRGINSRYRISNGERRDQTGGGTEVMEQETERWKMSDSHGIRRIGYGGTYESGKPPNGKK